jgi:hypothetical protein
VTGPGPDDPDAALDAALGIDALPPAAVVPRHLALCVPLWLTSAYLSGPEFIQRMAQLVADAEQRAVARYIAEHTAAGTPPVPPAP